ncbi:MAG: glycosyltransferase family 4 protein [Candidatus Woesearchaeota archaeon]
MDLRIAILVGGLGVDGVTLEALKKKRVLEDMGHYVKIITGRKNHRTGRGIIEKPDLFDFRAETHGIFEPVAFPYLRSSMLYSSYPEVKELSDDFQKQLLSRKLNSKTITQLTQFYLEIIAVQHEHRINYLLDEEQIDLIIPENLLAMPMQLPLALALTNIIEKRNFPTIASHHDFYFERNRFRGSTIKKYLKRCFPPTHSSVKHIVLNSRLNKLLRNPKSIKYSPAPDSKINSLILPNCFDFEFDPDKIYDDVTDSPKYPRKDSYNKDFREQLGFEKDDILFLQNTRIVHRKNIERSIDLLKSIKKMRPEKRNKYKLIISISSRDEGDEYYDSLVRYIRENDLTIGRSSLKGCRTGDVVFTGERVGGIRRRIRGKKVYHYYDTYPNCDFCLYPSEYEGWGNVIGEAVQAKIPLLVNKYPIYMSDIRKYGFRFIEINDKITPKIVSKVLDILENKNFKKEITEHNFQVGKKNISLKKINDIFISIFSDTEFMKLVEKRRSSLQYRLS